MPALPVQIIKQLQELKENNNREWYETKKDEYTQLMQEFKTFGTALEADINRFDTVQRMKVYRPYRDLRFSKDKTPYHTYRGISFFRKGKGEYYINIEPDDCFLIVGYWAITPEDLKRLRQEFSYDSQEIQEILNRPSFKKYFNSLLPFEVKTAPKGFDKNHPNIEFIRKKSLLVKRKLSEKEIFQPNFYESVIDTFKTGNPLLEYINDILSTDVNGMPIN